MKNRFVGTGAALLLFIGAFGGVPHTRDEGVPAAAEPMENAAGDVHGTVQLQIPAESAPAMLSPYARRRYSPPAPASRASSSPQSVVVYIVVTGRGTDSPRDGVIRQRNRTIVPAVTAIGKGGRINFPNEDDVFHNLFSLSGPRPFNLGRYAPGASRSVRFDTEGVVRVFCDIHSDMSATILVLNTPYFTRPDESGAYTIRGVPEGRHRIVAWHESTGPITSEIVVSAGGSTRADIRVAS